MTEIEFLTDIKIAQGIQWITEMTVDTRDQGRPTADFKKSSTLLFSGEAVTTCTFVQRLDLKKPRDSYDRAKQIRVGS